MSFLVSDKDDPVAAASEILGQEGSGPVVPKNNVSGFGMVHTVDIVAKSVGVSVAQKAKKSKDKDEGEQRQHILQDVSLRVPAGKLLAIMGGSGSGKTTLLNALAGRSPVPVSGEITFNGGNPKKYFQSGMVAYVEQQDQLLPYISVRETLRYAARLRLPRSMPLAKKFELVESVILELGLKECANTLVGDEWRKGISGGEKRRVSVGVQLLLNPSVIFLDEPTTGLDAFNARSLIETLVSLAHNSGRTIVLSIHQPRSDIFAHFDQIALLARGGRLAYCGPPKAGIEFFESIGFPLIGDMNGADFLIDTIAVDDRTEESAVQTSSNVETIVGAWQQRAVDESNQVIAQSGSGVNGVMFEGRVQGAGFFEQVYILTKRMLANLWEDRLTQWGSIIEIVLMGLIIGCIYYRLDEDPGGVYGRRAAMFLIVSLPNYLGVTFMVYKLSLEIKVFDRERMDKMYSVPAYLASWVGVHFTAYGILAILFSVIVYFMIGFRTDNLGFHFGIFTLNSILQQWIVMGFAYFCIGFARDFAGASLIANTLITFIFLAAGFLVPEPSVPIFIRWFEWLSFATYSFRLNLVNEFKDNVYACPSIARNDTVNLVACDGNSVIASTGFNNDMVVPTIGLFGVLIVKLLIAALMLQYFPVTGSKQGASVSEKKQSKAKEVVQESAIQIDQASLKPPAIMLELKDLSMDLDFRKSLSFSKTKPKLETKQILQSVSARFPPGQLTAILGSSGAGKSTLLHLLHARTSDLPSHVSARQSGTMLHNGIEFSKEAIDACTASVRQDDSHLLPALTARETLVYAALLRLPSAWPKERKIERAEEVLLELGLKECANTVVGGEGVKGLSGGEKRRLSVGLAMLMDPAILLLDEPTSGLDASSARNMMITLKAIAAEGRTVICTIHQPRSDIFPLLDRILLLARGGRVVYQGAGSALVPHFSSLNYQLPALTNPADFALDLASVDLRNEVAENETRARVDGLIEVWNKSGAHDESSSSSIPQLSGEETTQRVLTLSSSKRLSLLSALPLLVSRSWINLKRQPGLIAARVMNIVALGVIFTMYYTKLTDDQAGVTSRFGLLHQIGSILFVGMLNCIAVFPQELLLFRFEHQDRTTSVEAFFLTYTINELPFEILGAAIYALLATYVMGLKINPGYLTVLVFCNVFSGESLGILFCTLFSKPGFSIQIMSAILSLLGVIQGFLSVNMASFLTWINYISILRYSARVLASQEFAPTRTFSCVEGLPCQYRTGTDVLNFLKFPTSDYDIMLNVVGLTIAVIVYRLIAFAVMKHALP